MRRRAISGKKKSDGHVFQDVAAITPRLDNEIEQTQRKEKSGEETREEDPIGWPEWMKRRRCVGVARLLQFESLGHIRILGGDFPCVQQRYVRLRRAVIPGLLKSRNKLEKFVAKARQREKVVWVLLVASWVLFASIIL
ncbi:hypothetical protein Pyn_10448 [Prunus yedoensis var. nudiflora]|uniref:Uncharacterized protein n=1 Tax=Prunus yedoensis var. nudiflora TaxID=2094558 RepID=A0A314ZRE4_PRUYE|nr:hypothetical protein Pyn_10448 [Prunus yedoensis var. nudiflora]